MATVTDEYLNRAVLVPRTRPAKSINNISTLSISTDSVAAILRVQVNPGMKKIIVSWGDGSQEVLNKKPGQSGPPLSAGGPALPPGTYEFVHVYSPPDDGMQFTHNVIVLVLDSDGEIDLRSQLITLTPRYRIDLFPTSIRLESPCDRTGSTSEFTIRLTQDDEVLEWNWEPSNNFFPSPYFTLAGSGLSGEAIPSEFKSSVTQTFTITERDPGPDTTVLVSVRGAWNDRDETVEVARELDAILFGSCTVRLRYFRRSRIIVPRQAEPPVFL